MKQPWVYMCSPSQSPLPPPSPPAPSRFSQCTRSFNFMAAITICSDFGAQKNKVWHCFHCFPIYFPWSGYWIFCVSWVLSTHLRTRSISRNTVSSLHYSVIIWLTLLLVNENWMVQESNKQKWQDRIILDGRSRICELGYIIQGAGRIRTSFFPSCQSVSIINHVNSINVMVNPSISKL